MNDQRARPGRRCDPEDSLTRSANPSERGMQPQFRNHNALSEGLESAGDELGRCFLLHCVRDAQLDRMYSLPGSVDSNRAAVSWDVFHVNNLKPMVMEQTLQALQ